MYAGPEGGAYAKNSYGNMYAYNSRFLILIVCFSHFCCSFDVHNHPLPQPTVLFLSLIPAYLLFSLLVMLVIVSCYFLLYSSSILPVCSICL